MTRNPSSTSRKRRQPHNERDIEPTQTLQNARRKLGNAKGDVVKTGTHQAHMLQAPIHQTNPQRELQSANRKERMETRLRNIKNQIDGKVAIPTSPNASIGGHHSLSGEYYTKGGQELQETYTDQPAIYQCIGESQGGVPIHGISSQHPMGPIGDGLVPASNFNYQGAVQGPWPSATFDTRHMDSRSHFTQAPQAESPNAQYGQPFTGESLAGEANAELGLEPETQGEQSNDLPTTQTESQSVYPAYTSSFGNNLERARRYRNRVRTLPYINPANDATIASVEGDRDNWIKKIYNAMVRGDLACDGPSAKSRKHWVQTPYFDVGEIKWASIELFEAVMDHCKNGFRLEKEDNKCPPAASRANPSDREATCKERITTIIESLEKEKTVCDDMMEGGKHIKMFVNAPLTYTKSKISNRNSNNQKKKMLELAKQTQAEEPKAQENLEDQARPKARKSRKRKENAVENVTPAPPTQLDLRSEFQKISYDAPVSGNDPEAYIDTKAASSAEHDPYSTQPVSLLNAVGSIMYDDNAGQPPHLAEPEANDAACFTSSPSFIPPAPFSSPPVSVPPRKVTQGGAFNTYSMPGISHGTPILAQPSTAVGSPPVQFANARNGFTTPYEYSTRPTGAFDTFQTTSHGRISKQARHNQNVSLFRGLDFQIPTHASVSAQHIAQAIVPNNAIPTCTMASPNLHGPIISASNPFGAQIEHFPTISKALSAPAIQSTVSNAHRASNKKKRGREDEITNDLMNSPQRPEKRPRFQSEAASGSQQGDDSVDYVNFNGDPVNGNDPIDYKIFKELFSSKQGAVWKDRMNLGNVPVTENSPIDPALFEPLPNFDPKGEEKGEDKEL
ncbi:hypothetical protein K432DRAFT_390274 [Lepidopterella palustris CBS 459.81]|uniref:Uncharacterized protein n=1 Tax=Lepidopterella palustris CBS 459.81 TaxID=1314670 RepID=A0A8E2JIJ5_9PEZI|nr:hypothetical protein K432DRAFT_390274 [Lepidopterella palustris CBS 459.81]